MKKQDPDPPQQAEQAETQPTAQDQKPPAQDTKVKKSKPPRARGSFVNRWRN